MGQPKRTLTVGMFLRDGESKDVPSSGTYSKDLAQLRYRLTAEPSDTMI